MLNGMALSTYTYKYCHMVVNYVDGIGVIVDTPSDIQPYLQEGERLIGWGYVYETERELYSHMWRTYLTSTRKIPGIYTRVSHTATDITLE